MSKISKQWIEDNAIDNTKILLNNNFPIRSRNAGDSADIEMLKVSATDIITLMRTTSMSNFKLTDLADPVDSLDAVNLQTLQAAVAGLSEPKDSARLATTAALPAHTYNEPGVEGIGATLTANASGAFPTIDGVTPILSDDILVKDEGSGSSIEHGVYVLTQVGDGGTPWILTRRADFDEDVEVHQGVFVPINEGANNAGLGFLISTANPITVGVTPFSFTQFGEKIEAGQGLIRTGSTLSVDIGDGLEFNGNAIDVDVDDADLVDGTTKLVSGSVSGIKSYNEIFVLTGTDISNQYVDLTKVASRNSISVKPTGAPMQVETSDFSLNYTGGTGSKTRLTFVGDMANPAVLKDGDSLYINYQSLDY